MRNRLKLLVSVFVVLFGFQACDNDDFSNIPDAAKQAFDKKYPNVKNNNQIWLKNESFIFR